MGKYFGTDGFRGKAGVDLTAEHAFQVGRFLGWYYSRKHTEDSARIVIGKDTRRSSYMFENALAAGITSSGADAYLLHVTTTPCVSYITRTENFDCGVMISASHNPFYDNGIKLMNGVGDISPFQACCTALASTLGVGNIAGVSVAIATGGPGAVFWMWAVALMGFIVKFSEITLGMAYRERDPETGRWHGGFYWYVRRGLGKSWKWLGIFWAVILGCAMVFAPAVQANSVVEAIRVSFDVPGWIVGVIFAVIMAVVLVGGIKSISSFAEKVVPLMALAYVIGSIFILVKFGSNIPHVFAMIFEYAFTPMAATGGFAGSTVMLAIRWGLARGVYSNEAGTGMAPLAHSSSSANHPVKQGLWGISEVFVDTIIVCTMTALVVLCTGVWTEGGTGAALTATAFGAGFGNAIAGTVFEVAIITFFAFTTALVNVYYGEICMTVLGGKKFILPYRLLGCAFAIIGSVGALSVLWNLFDFFFGVCAVCNLVVCFLMRKQIGALINDYLTRLKSGKWEPTSEAAANAIPELWVNDKAAK